MGDSKTVATVNSHLHAISAGEDVVNEVVREQDVSGPLENLQLVPLHPEHLWRRETCRLLIAQEVLRRLDGCAEGGSVKKGYLLDRYDSKKQCSTSV